MTSANRRISANVSVYPKGLLFSAATLLIILGVAFEAVEIVWARLLSNGFWLFSVILPGLWNMLAVLWQAPVWQELLRVVPLAMVATGVMILFGRKNAHTNGRSLGTHNGGSHNE